MKQKIKFRVLFLIVPLLLFNCQNDDLDNLENEKNNQIQSEARFKTYLHKQPKIQQNQNLSIQLIELQKSILENKEKSVNADLYDFTVQTEYASYIEATDGSFHSYTFPIVRDVDNELLENLVLTLEEDQSYSALLISYTLTNQELNDIRNNIEIDLTGKSTITEITDEYLIIEVLANKTCGYEAEQTCAFEIHPTYVEYNCNTQYVYTCNEIQDSSGGSLPNNNDGSLGGGGGLGGTATNPVNQNLLNWEDFIDQLDRVVRDYIQFDLVLNTQIYQYLIANDFSDDAEEFAERTLEIVIELEDNPFYLLEIDCNQLPNWQTLAQHHAPQSVQDKINNLPSGTFNDFEIQSLEDANGTMVNLDYFSVNITTLPNDPSTGQQFTADEFQDYFRRNINDFVDGSTFEPYCEIPSICQQETDLWNSDNPLGALIYIDIPFDDGAVICTEYIDNYWYFMTMNAPFAGNHPVSGTRQFGYETNTDGSIDFFARGVDRFDSNLIENVSYARGLGNPFFGADNLWESFQDKINDFVNDPINGGSSSINNPIKSRPDWDKVQEVLEGERPISDLGCN